MTTSGTYAFAPQVDELLAEAWERCGKEPGVITGDMARSARRSLQLALLDWSNRELNLWQVDTAGLVLVPNQVAYPLPPETVDLLWATVAIGGSDRWLASISGDTYAALPNKLTPGPPTQCWVERVLPVPVLHVYPAPDQAYTAALRRMLLPQDVSALSQTAAVPALWLEALTGELARRLAQKYAFDRLAPLTLDAQQSYASASGEDRERAPLTLLPDVGYR